MKIVLSKHGVPIRLSEERMAHIARRHPEMQSQETKILETVCEPDLIQEGDAGTKIALKHYPVSPLTEKFCAVVYRGNLRSGRARPNRVLLFPLCSGKEDPMEAVKLFEKKDVPLEWEYDGEADALYISFGPPKPATGVDVGEGVIIRYDEKAREVVGLTIVGVGRRLEEHVRSTP